MSLFLSIQACCNLNNKCFMCIFIKFNLRNYYTRLSIFLL